jgi:hypothetical protein
VPSAFFFKSLSFSLFRRLRGNVSANGRNGVQPSLTTDTDPDPDPDPRLLAPGSWLLAPGSWLLAPEKNFLLY